ncbi:Laccase-4-like [Oopsacas minuta]|uniref:Laccase-4-like n=1 Tax=Oopsacas minuta TaxID=111878 RepID=A0AAV7JKI6_9METZ|nr:Laccase-4-like [Oopsacas minuta]
MDGVGEITQCPIEPATTFTHAFITTVPGSYWYHSHTGTQRADGIFGGLVVRENGDSTTQARNAFESYGIGTFLDYPDRHTIVVSDWFEGTSLNDFVQFEGGLGFHPSIPIQDVPTRNDPTFEETQYYDGGGGAIIPFYSALINGLGKHESVAYVASRLSEFRVEQGNMYRFRLVGAQSEILLRFSIDGHNLTTIATDAYFIEPIEDVNYIILHSGERYDFLLNANAVIGNYIMRLETMEADANCFNDAPFASLNHYTEAILHYETAEYDNGIPSTAYQAISESSPQRDCTVGPRCRAVNCPFENFHPSYGIDCINVGSFQLLIDTPPSELPEAYASDPSQLFFLNFNFEGPSFQASINGRSFVLPPYPPQTNDLLFNEYSDVCNNFADCSIHPSDQFSCDCTHVLTFDFNKTVQIVVSAVGEFLSAHPLHIHGHTYHVVKVGYPTYYENNGYAAVPNPDIDCGQGPQQTTQARSCGAYNFSCTNPSWSEPSPILTINSKTPRKDVIIVPTGGYVVVNLISDNPGWWFAHCHIEPHQLNGMALVINEAPGYQNPAPEELVNCQDYIFNSEEFYELIAFNPNQAGTIQVSIILLLMSMLALLIVF